MVSSINSTNFLQVLETNSDTVNLHIKNNVNLAKISGTHDENFLLLEKLSNTKISLRGNHITIKGNNKNSETVVSVINLLLKKSFEKDDIDQEDVKSIFSFESKNLADEKFTEIAPGIKTLKKTVLPRTAKQKKYVKDLRSNNIIFALGPAGTGKCLGLNTPIIMFDCSIKMVQDVKTNDLIMGDDSSARRVLSITSGEDELYKVSTNFGDSYIVNSAHILTFVSIKHFRSRKGKTILSWMNEFGKVLSKSFFSRKEAEEESLLLPFFVDLPTTGQLSAMLS